MDQDLARLSSSVAPKNVIAATNSYDVEYLKHYTGISETFLECSGVGPLKLMEDDSTLYISAMKPSNLIIILDPVLLEAFSGFYTSKFQYKPTRPEVLLLGHINMDSFCPSIDRTRHVVL